MSQAKRVVATIQARMGSTRLPDKALTDSAGEPMPSEVVHRICRAETPDCERIISLPVFPRMTDADVDDVIGAVHKVTCNHGK